MATVQVLRAGYSRQDADGASHACGTITLIRSTVNVLVDTGNPADGDEIVRLLKAEGLSPDDVSVVVCTHGHVDHAGCNALFPHALFIVSRDIATGDRIEGRDFAQDPYVIDDDVQVIGTPGHMPQDVSVLAKTPEGLVAVVGDLFESEEDLKDPSRWLVWSNDPETQKNSRDSVLMTAGYIVPGHGGMFRVPWAVG
jgi:glyoxylase-like metal-dependent hydrolase (beta-lactamase superfamily II)